MHVIFHRLLVMVVMPLCLIASPVSASDVAEAAKMLNNFLDSNGNPPEEHADPFKQPTPPEAPSVEQAEIDMPEIPGISGRERVVILHGIGRTSMSMADVARAFRAAGYKDDNLGYKSTRDVLRKIIDDTYNRIRYYSDKPSEKVNFVCYSLGCIVTRGLIEQHRPANLGRVVMLGPPNQGSEMADYLKDRISPKSVEDTINRRIAMADEEASLLLPGQSVTASQGFTAYEHQGYVTAYGQSAGCSDADDCPEDPKEVEFPQDASGFAMVCSTPATNIKVYEGCGPLCTVTRIIMGLLNTASEGLVNATVANNTFQNAVLAALTLYITIYGAMVVLGMVQVALGDAVMRIFKMSIVAMLLSSETVMTFFHMGRCFFIEGTTYLVNGVLSIGVEAVASIGAPGDINIESLYPGMSNVDQLEICWYNTRSILTARPSTPQ